MPSKVEHGDASNRYEDWPTPTTIVSDGAYGVGSFDGDPSSASDLDDWYRSHIEAWSEHSTPETTLWFWNTELGWATVHPVLEAHGWEYRGANTWDKGLKHIAGNSNTETLRRFPPVTEVCVQYVREDSYEMVLSDDAKAARDWFRNEWERTGLPFREANDACGVADAATRKWLSDDEMFYPPPEERLEKLVAYANEHGDSTRGPFFDFDTAPLSRDEFLSLGGPRVEHATTFNCPAGTTNVWRESEKAGERELDGTKATHPNQKPLSLMERIVRASTDKDDIVWEPFGGLCSATVAAARLDRESYAAEIDEEYVEIGRKRLRNVSVVDGVGQQGLAAFADGGQAHETK